jgi:hypothetical protein
MTTTVIVRPNGHNVEVVTTDNGVEAKHTPNPHGESMYSIFDNRTITVRETEGWAEKPVLTHGH